MHNINLMDTTPQYLQKLLKIQTGTLFEIGQQYRSHYKDVISVYESAQTLSNLLHAHDLDFLQRIIAIYLLLISYDGAGLSNPFVFTLLDISENTEETLERRMIGELLMTEEKQKSHFQGLELEGIREVIEKELDMCEESKQIIELRREAAEKYREMHAFMEIHKETEVPDTEMEFLLPFPDFLKINVSEMHWLFPGIISDVEWDNTADIDRKLEKVRKIFNTALEKQLQPTQRQELLNSIETDPHSALHIGLRPELLTPLLNNNPYIASSIIIKSAKYSVFQFYLQQLLNMPTSILLIDTMARLVKQLKLPHMYVVIFCSHHMGNIVKGAGDPVDKKSLVFTMTAFLQCMVENYVISPAEIKNELKKFMEEFSEVIDFGYFKQQLDKICH